MLKIFKLKNQSTSWYCKLISQRVVHHNISAATVSTIKVFRFNVKLKLHIHFNQVYIKTFQYKPYAMQQGWNWR